MSRIIKRAPKDTFISGTLIARITKQNNWEVKDGCDTIAIIDKAGIKVMPWEKLNRYQVTHVLELMKSISKH